MQLVSTLEPTPPVSYRIACHWTSERGKRVIHVREERSCRIREIPAIPRTLPACPPRMVDFTCKEHVHGSDPYIGHGNMKES